MRIIALRWTVTSRLNVTAFSLYIANNKYVIVGCKRNSSRETS